MKNDLTQGNILKQLTKLALPIMGASFIQMAYNITDMFWIGKIGSSAVAAVGTAGFFVWMSMAFILISKIGGQVLVSQFFGKKDYSTAKSYAKNALVFNSILALAYMMILLIFQKQLISFFNLGEEYVINTALIYLRTVSLGMLFSFNNPVFSGIINGTGDSKSPFIIASTGLIINMILDPLFILVFNLEAFGAALATVIAQGLVFVLYIVFLKSERSPFDKFRFNFEFHPEVVHKIIKIGLPEGVRSGMFTFFAMVLARILAYWGPLPIGIQKVGSQIESISWMTAGGFSMALASFVGQNYGANQPRRIIKGYKYSIITMSIIGVITSALLILLSEQIMSMFFSVPEEIKAGSIYLKILGVSQFFMCIEITTAGLFNGLGKTIIPSVISIIFTGMRIPLALIISDEKILGLIGVWWSISITSIIKGVIIVLVLALLLKREKLFIFRQE